MRRTILLYLFLGILAAANAYSYGYEEELAPEVTATSPPCSKCTTCEANEPKCEDEPVEVKPEEPEPECTIQIVEECDCENEKPDDKKDCKKCESCEKCASCDKCSKCGQEDDNDDEDEKQKKCGGAIKSAKDILKACKAQPKGTFKDCKSRDDSISVKSGHKVTDADLNTIKNIVGNVNCIRVCNTNSDMVTDAACKEKRAAVQNFRESFFKSGKGENNGKGFRSFFST